MQQSATPIQEGISYQSTLHSSDQHSFPTCRWCWFNIIEALSHTVKTTDWQYIQQYGVGNKRIAATVRGVSSATDTSTAAWNFSCIYLDVFKHQKLWLDMIYMIYTRNHVANYGDFGLVTKNMEIRIPKNRWHLTGNGSCQQVGLELSDHWQLHLTRVATFSGAFFFWSPGDFLWQLVMQSQASPFLVLKKRRSSSWVPFAMV